MHGLANWVFSDSALLSCRHVNHRVTYSLSNSGVAQTYLRRIPIVLI